MYMEMRKSYSSSGTILFIFGLPFDTYAVCTVITEHEILIGDQINL